MRGKEKQQDDLFSSSIYDARIPKDHFLRKLKDLLDWHALASELDDCYRSKGRASVPPEVMLKVMILQYLYDLSDRQFEEQLRFRLDFMFFLGLSLDEAGPDHSTLSRFRGRVGAVRFARIFNRIVEAAREKELISDRLHAIDSRHFKANVSTWKRRDHETDDDDPPSGFVKFDDSPSGSPDPDARWGAKSKTLKFFGYKHHIAVDTGSGLIVTSVTTPGNRNDGAEMPSLVDDRAGAVTADKAYDSGKNHQLLVAKGIGDRIIRRKSETEKRNNTDRWVVERTNGIIKRWCGGGRARYWGLEKVSIQMTLASIAANIKRMISLGATALAPAV
jgi:IS5 family transposase